ncbi:MAG: VOC family protein [Actinobacteria bacterium]|nr:VOC family protein [Actinomycetota bacterium]
MALLDHLVFATPDLETTVGWLTGTLGVEPTPGGRHPGLGTRNALLGLGAGAYLEIIAVDPAVQGPPEAPRPFGLDRIADARLATWAAGVDDIDARVVAARAAGYDPGPVRPMSRRLPDGSELQWRLTAPAVDPVAVVPFLIEWAGGAPHPSATSAQGCRLVRLTAGHPDPDRVRARLAALAVTLTVSPSAAPELVAAVEGPGGAVELR